MKNECIYLKNCTLPKAEAICLLLINSNDGEITKHFINRTQFIKLRSRTIFNYLAMCYLLLKIFYILQICFKV
jgi:hypothetical protein